MRTTNWQNGLVWLAIVCAASLICRTVQGMSVYDVQLMLVGLHIEDTPLSFQPPRGPRVNLTVTYNQREANQPATFPYSNFGQKWTCNWISYITDGGTTTNTADVQYYVGGGGTEIFTGFNTNNQTFAPNWRDQAVLLRTSTNYIMTLPNGSQMIFAQPDGSVGNTRKIFLTQVTDPTGYTNLVQYDSSLRLAAVYDPVDQTNNLTFYYNSSQIAGSTNSIQMVKDRYLRTATFGYGNLLTELDSITDPIGMTSSFDYNLTFINSMTTPYGTTTFAYGENGTTRWLETTDSQGAKSRVEYNELSGIGIPFSDSGTVVPQGMLTRNSVLDSRNTFYWDKKAQREAPGDYSKARLYHWLHSPDLASTVGVLESIKQPFENRVWFNYTGQTTEFSATAQGTLDLPSVVGRVLDDGSGQFYQYYRNSVGNTTNAIDPIGRTFTYSYAPNGIDLLGVRQTSDTNNQQLLASFTYNTQHLPSTATDASGQTTSFGYNTYGQITAVTNALNYVTAFLYDSAGHLQTIDGPLPGTNDTINFTYDGFDRVFSVTDVDGYTVTNYYDALDRVTTNLFPDGSSEVFTYTNLDVGTFTDRAGKMTQFVYDSLGQLSEIHQSTNWITRFAWDRCGGLQTLTDPLGQNTRWNYDIQGRLKSKQYADGSQVQYGYESTTSRLKTFTNERNQTRSFFYWQDGLLGQINYANPSITPPVTYYYDTHYPRLSVTFDGLGGSNLFAYNAITTTPALGAGRLYYIDKYVGGSTRDEQLIYGYDALGRLNAEQIYNDFLAYNSPGFYYGYVYQNLPTYDALGRITNVLTPIQYVTGPTTGTTYTYDGASSRLLSVTFPIGATSSYTYTNAQGDFRLTQISNSIPGASSPFSLFRYAYDSVGNITTWMQQEGTNAAQYYRLTYDPIYELTNASVVVGSSTNQINYRFDLAGNRLSETIGSNTLNASFNPLNQLVTKDTGQSSTNRQYAWDEENRLSAIIEGTNTTRLFYDEFGRCKFIIESSGGVNSVTRYLNWSGNKLCEERNIAGSAAYYKWYYDEGCVDFNSIYTVSGHLYFMRDHLGSIREAVDDNGNLVREFGYDLFGRTTFTDSPAGTYSGEPHGGPLMGFAGRFTVTPQNLIMSGNRFYDPDLGRWISRNPGGESTDANLYRYGGNNPISSTGP